MRSFCVRLRLSTRRMARAAGGRCVAGGGAIGSRPVSAEVDATTPSCDPVTWAEFIESALLAQYRRDHGVPMAELREFIEGLRSKTLGLPYPNGAPSAVCGWAGTRARGLGASEIVPRDGDVAAAVRDRFPGGADALLDLVNYAPGTYDAGLKDRARNALPTGATSEGPGRTMVMAVPTAENLERSGSCWPTAHCASPFA
jgi:hypothetical protein